MPPVFLPYSDAAGRRAVYFHKCRGKGSGRRIATPGKGLYIKNGKKVLVK
ncbi:MAG: hypothetical protein MR881_07960 [Bacteroidales bacterium]|nr:hypothetical protein [Bacteroidales bacterium]